MAHADINAAAGCHAGWPASRFPKWKPCMDIIASPIYYHGVSGQLIGLENMGIFIAYGMENGSASKLKELRDFGKTLK